MAEQPDILDTSGMTKRRFSDFDFPLDSDEDQARIYSHQPIRFLSISQVLDRLSVGRSTLYAQIKDPRRPFPAPIHIGRRSVWVEDEVENYMRQVVSENRASPQGIGDL